MASYTIHVNNLYKLNILAPIAEMLDWREDRDEYSMDLELQDSLACLLSELSSGKLRFDVTLEYPEKWRLIAHLAANLSSKITESMMVEEADPS